MGTEIAPYSVEARLPPTLRTLEERTSWLMTPVEKGIVANLERVGISRDRFQASISAAFAKVHKLWECDLVSLQTALLHCSNDGLLPDGRRAALVPFFDNKAKRMLCQYMPMVQGIISRLRVESDVFSVTCEVVYECDTFEYDLSDPHATVHKPGPAAERNDDRKICSVYVIFRDKQRNVIHREIMSRKDIDASRKVSRAENSPAWRDWFPEMARKTVIRRGSKYVPMSDAMRTIIERDDEYVQLDAITSKAATPADYDPLAAPEAVPALAAPVDDEVPVRQLDATDAAFEPVPATAPGGDHPEATGNADADLLMELRVALESAATKADIIKTRDQFFPDGKIPKAAERLIGQRRDAIADAGGKRK